MTLLKMLLLKGVSICVMQVITHNPMTQYFCDLKFSKIEWNLSRKLSNLWWIRKLLSKKLRLARLEEWVIVILVLQYVRIDYNNLLIYQNFQMIFDCTLCYSKYSLTLKCFISIVILVPQYAYSLSY